MYDYLRVHNAKPIWVPRKIRQYANNSKRTGQQLNIHALETRGFYCYHFRIRSVAASSGSATPSSKR